MLELAANGIQSEYCVEPRAGLHLEDVSCCMCGQSDAVPVAVGEDFEYHTSHEAFLALSCRRCGVVYLSPRPTADSLPCIYPANYHAFNFSAERFGLAYKVRTWLEKRRILGCCRDLNETARILDVGCGDGFHVRLLRKFGRPEWKIEGIDTDVRAVDAARASGLDIHLGDVHSADLPPSSYDLVLLIMTVEHLPDPLDTLHRIRELLRPGGRVLVITDNTATFDFKIFGRRHWGGYHFPRHSSLFDSKSLRALLERADLKVDEVTTLLSPVNSVYSIRNLLVDWKAPSWLVERFSLSARASLGVFTLVDAFWMMLGRGAILRGIAHRPKTLVRSQSPSPTPRARAISPRPPVAIVGAGLAGLVAANQLQRRSVPYRLYEAGKQIAGLAKSFRDEDGFSYDFGAHFITNRLAAALGIGARCRDVRLYGEAVFLAGRSLSYPWGLAGSPRLLSSVVRAKLSRGTRSPATAADAFIAEYGDVFARLIAIPLTERWSGVPAPELAPSVAEKIPGGIGHLINMSLAQRFTHRAVAHGYCSEQPESTQVWHVYPNEGLSTLCEHLASRLDSAIELQSPVERIIVERGRVRAIRVLGEEHEVSAVMSTAPVNVLAKLVEGSDALKSLARFKYRPMTFVNLRFEGRGLLPTVVVWFPEAEYPFFRLTEAPLSMPWLAPEGMTLLTADLSCEIGDAVWTMTDEQLGELCLESISRVVPDARSRYRGCRVLRTALAYPVFRNEYEVERRALAGSTGVAGLYSIGRNGEFAHLLMEDVYWRTLRRTSELAAWLDSETPPVHLSVPRT